MYVSKSLTFPTPHIGHSRHGLFFTRLDSNAKPSEKDHDLPGGIVWMDGFIHARESSLKDSRSKQIKIQARKTGCKLWFLMT
jgi:hypothetical protein